MFDALVDWGGWGSWLAELRSAKLESGGPGVAGSVRIVEAPGAPPIRERLTACDELGLTMSYVIEGTPPFPARTYAATVRLLPLTDRAATVVEWLASFDADGSNEDHVRSALEGVYVHFIEALAAGCTTNAVSVD